MKAEAQGKSLNQWAAEALAFSIWVRLKDTLDTVRWKQWQKKLLL